VSQNNLLSNGLKNTDTIYIDTHFIMSFKPNFNYIFLKKLHSIYFYYNFQYFYYFNC